MLQRTPINRGIKWQFVVTSIGLVVGLVAVLTSIHIAVHRQALIAALNERIDMKREILVERGETLSENLARQAKNDIARFNLLYLTELITGVVKEDNALNYAILMDLARVAHIYSNRPDLHGKTLTSDVDTFAATVEDPEIYDYQTDRSRYLEFIVPIQFNLERWGVLRLGYSLDELDDEIQKSEKEINDRIHGMIKRSVITSLLFIVAAALIALWMATRISTPLLYLAETSRKLADGDFSAAASLDVQAQNEVGDLACAFVNMSEKLRISHDQLEEYSRNLEERVKERTKELKLIQVQLFEVEKMAALGRLVAGIAHEINTPVGIGLTGTSKLHESLKDLHRMFQEDDISREDLESYFSIANEGCEIILKNLHRAAELVHSFKQVAVDQSDGQNRRFRLKTYLNEIIMTLRPKIDRTRVKVTVSCDDSIEIVAHPGVYSQIITNLITNSLAHGYLPKETGTIIIKATVSDKILQLSFTDDGTGINHSDIGHIFEPFFTTNREAGGSGLGLHIVYNLVTQSLGGVIKCDSKIGEFTTFTITVPLD